MKAELISIHRCAKCGESIHLYDDGESYPDAWGTGGKWDSPGSAPWYCHECVPMCGYCGSAAAVGRVDGVQACVTCEAEEIANLQRA